MKKWLVLILIFLSFSLSIHGQKSFPGNPDEAIFLTKDVDNFWSAFDDFLKDESVNNFGKKYIELGSQGVKDFTPYRIESAEHLYSVVKERKSDYLKIRETSLQIKETEGRCRSIFYALKYWYPQAKFPPVYFVMGAFNSGGTSSGNGLIIGAEKQTDVSNIPNIVAHELIHFQQRRITRETTLLEQSVIEGSADFLGSLIAGYNVNQNSFHIYGNKNEERLAKEFIAKMNGTDYTDWLYGTSGKDDRPNDLGYWLGYQITKSYFAKSPNKKRAVYDILNIRDYKEFLNKSGYLNKYINPNNLKKGLINPNAIN